MSWAVRLKAWCWWVVQGPVGSSFPLTALSAIVNYLNNRTGSTLSSLQIYGIWGRRELDQAKCPRCGKTPKPPQLHPGLSESEQECRSRRWEADIPCVQPLWVHCWSTVPTFGLPSTRKALKIWTESERHTMEGERVREKCLLSWEEKAWGETWWLLEWAGGCRDDGN